MLNTLVVDNLPDSSNMIINYLRQNNYKAQAVDDFSHAMQNLKNGRYDVVFLNCTDTTEAGLMKLEEIFGRYPDTKVVVISSGLNVETAVKIIKLGAYDLLLTPVNVRHLLSILEEIDKSGRNGMEDAKSKQQEKNVLSLDDLSGSTDFMQALVSDLKEYAKSDIRILLTGATGTGKGAIAKAIHKASNRGKKNFVEINCSAIPAYLFESEIFGNERGAFTDATRSKKGLMELADKGTLFLDEIGDMPSEFQSKLLKAIEDNSFYRLGGEKPINVDVRIISATNQNFENKIEEGLFRSDLFFRLSPVRFELPTLLERKADIIPLAENFIRTINSEMHRNITGMSDSVKSALLKHDWPGNIRELRNVIERMMITCHSDMLESIDIPEDLIPRKHALIIDPSKIQPLEEIHRKHILQTLYALEGNRVKTAEVLGIARSTLFEKLKLYGVNDEEVEQRSSAV